MLPHQTNASVKLYNLKVINKYFFFVQQTLLIGSCYYTRLLTMWLLLLFKSWTILVLLILCSSADSDIYIYDSNTTYDTVLVVRLTEHYYYYGTPLHTVVFEPQFPPQSYVDGFAIILTNQQTACLVYRLTTSIWGSFSKFSN